ncbi:hypothetical protein O181_008603 [Austropuccinia psidii MF-1]|uniref:Uncharacterized protein n=1 Tax=Austropuccinia psidii MF-1 TaxID=1389203 RepID=A0A9Q3BPG2_9BASI|nr:hypothetical protein [Austropuccinia psidii MF-1]
MLGPLKTSDGDHSGQTLDSCFGDAMEEKDHLDCVYLINGDNTSSNITMAKHLKGKFQAIGFQWPGQEQYHCGACNVIFLVVKEFLKSMGKLIDEDYEYFNHYLSNQQFPIVKSDFENDTPILQVKSLKHKSSVPSCYTKCFKARVLNTATLETQQQRLKNWYHLSDEPTTSHVPSSPEDHELSNQAAGNPKRPISTVQALQELFSHISLAFINSNDVLELFSQTSPACSTAQEQHSTLYSNTPWEHLCTSMEFMEPILQMFKGACNLFQCEGQTKHLALPVYNLLIKKLHHYACDSPPAWSQACCVAIKKMHKYKDHEMKNNDTLMVTLLNPTYWQRMFKLIGLSPQQSQEVMDALSQEYLILTADSSPKCEDL